MKRYLQAIYHSFGNPALYARVVYRWTGNGFVYLLVFALLFGLLLSTQFALAIHRFNTDELPHILPQIPDIQVKNGVLETSINQPHVIRSTDQVVIATIDTTKDEADLRTENGTFLFGKDFILARQSSGDVRRIALKDIGDGSMSITKTTITHMLHQMTYMAFLLTPFLTLMQWLMLIAMAIMAACLSYIVTAYMPEEFNFETRMRIGAIAITPPLLINKILQITTPYHLGFWAILAIWVLHLYVIIIATRHYVQKHAVDGF